MPTTHPPAYLVEILAPVSTETLETDLHADLGVAIDRIYSHFAGAGRPVGVESSYTEDGELEGIAFFDQAQQLVACMTVYRLDRDCDEVATPGIVQALALAEPARTAALGALFTF